MKEEDAEIVELNKNIVDISENILYIVRGHSKFESWRFRNFRLTK